jgi:hypothetical protein
MAPTQRATKWSQKFTLLLIFLTFRRKSEGILFKEDIIFVDDLAYSFVKNHKLSSKVSE